MQCDVTPQSKTNDGKPNGKPNQSDFFYATKNGNDKEWMISEARNVMVL